MGNLANAALIDEAAHEDQALIFRQRIDQLGQHRLALDGALDAGILNRLIWQFGLAVIGLPAIVDGVGGDAHQPCREGNASPFEAAEIRQRLVKDLSSQLFGLIAVVHTARDEGVHAIEVLLVQFRKARRVLLRCFDQKPLVGKVFDCTQEVLRGTPT